MTTPEVEAPEAPSVDVLRAALQQAQVQRYEPFLIEVPEGEEPYEDSFITHAEPDPLGIAWDVRFGSGWCLMIPSLPIGRYSHVLREAIVPKVGDRIRLYGSFGSPIQGIQINDDVVFYRDEIQRMHDREHMVLTHEAEKRRAFVFTRADLDAQYDALPDVLKARIDRFRAERADFRWDAEGYEIFCCTEAAKVVEWAKATAPEDVAEWFFALGQRPEDGGDPPLVTMVEEAGVMDTAAHSGNTFHGSLRLAYGVLKGEVL